MTGTGGSETRLEPGVEYLHAWAVSIRQTRRRLTEFLEAYEVQFGMNHEGGE